MKSSWISLDRLPSMSRKPFVAAAWAVENLGRRIQSRKAGSRPRNKVGESSSTPLQLERSARVSIFALCSQIKSEKNPASARALHRIVKESVMLLNSLVLSRRRLFRPIGERASGWPLMHSDLPDEIKRNEKVLSVLALGTKSGINATKQSPRDRLRKHSQTDPATKLTMKFVGNLQFLKGISSALQADNPSPQEFTMRIKKIVKQHRLPTSLLEVIGDCAFLGNPSKDTLEQYHKLIVRMLRIETNGHPERVRELRPLGVSKASSVTSDFDKLQAEQSLQSDSAVIMFLKKSKGSSAIERAIGEEIENKLRQRMASWLR